MGKVVSQAEAMRIKSAAGDLCASTVPVQGR